jgi:hypothetical protein
VDKGGIHVYRLDDVAQVTHPLRLKSALVDLGVSPPDSGNWTVGELRQAGLDLASFPLLSEMMVRSGRMRNLRSSTSSARAKRFRTRERGTPGAGVWKVRGKLFGIDARPPLNCVSCWFVGCV